MEEKEMKQRPPLKECSCLMQKETWLGYLTYGRPDRLLPWINWSVCPNICRAAQEIQELESAMVICRCCGRIILQET